MYFKAFHYDVSATIRLSRQQISDLIELSQCHYDAWIKSAGRQGGWLSSWLDKFNCCALPTAEANIQITRQQSSLICEIIELTPEDHPMREHWQFFHETLLKLQQESNRISKVET